MRAFLFLILLILPCISPANTVLDAANEAYRNGNYKSAIQNYEQLIESGMTGADLHYNLGNAYFRDKQWGNAVLHFEKAKRYNPRDPEILHNLKVVKTKLSDQFEEIPEFFLNTWWKNLRAIMGSTAWAILGLLCLWGGVAGIIYRYRATDRNIRKKSFLIGITFIVLSILPFMLSFSAAYSIQNTGRAVIISKVVKLKSAPDIDSKVIMELHEGTSLELIDQIETWYKIRLVNGEEGWLSSEKITKI